MDKISVIIRTFNEEKYITKLLHSISIQKGIKDTEIVIVDSGSTDSTIDIVSQYEVKLIQINPEEFTFGYSLNKGVETATGSICVLVSAHCYPTDEYWLKKIVKPFESKDVALVFGKQRGVDTTKFSENQIFAKLFPDTSIKDYQLSFANNANSAIRRSIWEKYKFDESLTGLEDIAFAKVLKQKGYVISYNAEAAVYHVHDESWKQIYRRYYREAHAYKNIFPDENFFFFDFVKLFFMNNVSDYIHAIYERSFFKYFTEITIFRFLQFLATYRSHQNHVPISKEMQKKLYYPVKPKFFFKTGKILNNFSKRNEKIFDITRPIHSKIPVWPGSKSFSITWENEMPKDDINESHLSLNSHTGTHIDAPFHFINDGGKIGDLSFNNLIGEAIVLEYLEKQPIEARFFMEYVKPKKHKRVLLKTLNSFDDNKSCHFNKKFIAITSDSAKWLADNGILLVGIDGPSIQNYYDEDNRTHQRLLNANVTILEGLDLSKVKPGLYNLVALPLYIPEAEGAPVRAILTPKK